MTAVEIKKTVGATPNQVYHALTNVPVLQRWFGNFVEFQAAEDGRFYAHWNQGYYVAGQVKAVKENEEVAYTWNGLGDPGESKVRFVLEAKGDGTLVTVLHSNFGEGEAWDAFKKTVEKEWEHSLENLAYLFEKGVDRRVYSRPFLGILLAGQIDEAQAEELGLPEATGVRISGTVPETGAAAADLQNNDVILKLGMHDASTFPALGAALDASKAGETLDVELYREGEKVTVPMQLSHRPIPELPTNTADLAKAMREQAETLAKELDEMLDGVSEEEAGARPAEDQWSAKEVLGHLLMNEYWFQLNVSIVAGGGRGGGYSNDLGTVSAIGNGFGDFKAVADQFKKNMFISAAAVEGLPEDVAARTHDLIQLGQWAVAPLGMINHTRGHYTQMQQAIETAREKVAA